MLMKLAVAALILTALWSMKPTVAQTAQGNDDRDNHSVKQTNSSQNPPAPTLTIIKENCDGEAFKDDGDCKTAKDKEMSVAVSKLPSAHVTIDRNSPRDGYDWLAYWSGIVLAAVGIVGIFFAVRTVNLMRRQVETFVSKERARITVDIGPFNPNNPNPAGILYDKSPTPPARFQYCHIDLRAANSGETTAFVYVALCKACIRGTRWDARKETITSQISLPKAMRAGEQPFAFKAGIETRDPSKLEIGAETAKAVADGSLHVYVIGHVEYGDVFDNRWVLKFCRQWGGTYSLGNWANNSSWLDYPSREAPGAVEMNDEFRVERPSKIRQILSMIRRKDPSAARIINVD